MFIYNLLPIKWDQTKSVKPMSLTLYFHLKNVVYNFEILKYHIEHDD